MVDPHDDNDDWDLEGAVSSSDVERVGKNVVCAISKIAVVLRPARF